MPDFLRRMGLLGQSQQAEQAAAERVVLRRLPDGRAPRRPLGHGIAETAETGIVQDGLAPVCQAALGDGRSQQRSAY